jgi:hypothetical protein
MEMEGERDVETRNRGTAKQRWKQQTLSGYEKRQHAPRHEQGTTVRGFDRGYS